MVKRVTAILLTFTIVLNISAGQRTYEESDSNNDHYLQHPQDYEQIDDYRDQTDFNQKLSPTRPDRGVTQSNDFLFNNNYRSNLRNNEQSQAVGSSNSRTLPPQTAGYSKNLNWNFKRGGSDSTYTGSSENQESKTYVGVNNNDDNTKDVSGGISFDSSNIFDKLSPSSGINFGFNVKRASKQPESLENGAYSDVKPFATLKGNKAESYFNKVFQAPDGRLMKLVELNEEDDDESYITNESQSSHKIKDGISHNNYYMNEGTTLGKPKNRHLGGHANINIGISKNIDVNGQLNLENAVNGAAGKVVDVTEGLVQRTGKLANRKSDSIHGSVYNFIDGVGTIKKGVVDTTGAIAGAKTNLIRGTVNGVTETVGSIKTGLLDTAGAAVNAKGKAIRGTVNSVAGKVGVIKDGLIHTAGAVTSAKTNAIRGTVNAVTGKVDDITEGLLHTAGKLANAKTSAIRGAVNGVTGKVDDLNKLLLHKAGLVVDAKTGAILGIVNKKSEGVENIKSGLLQAAESIAGSKSKAEFIGSEIDNIGEIESKNLQAAKTIGIIESGARSGSENHAYNDIGRSKSGLAKTTGSFAGAKSGSIFVGAKSGSVGASESVNVGGSEGSGSIEFSKGGSLIEALNPLNIGRKVVNGGVATAGAVAGALGEIKSGAVNVTDRILHPGKYYGIGAIKRKVVNNILDDVQDKLQTKIGNVAGTIGHVKKGVKNHITDLSLIDNHGDKNVLRIVNGLYDTQFYMNDTPVENAYVIFSDENHPVNFFGETLDTQQRIIEECIPSGQVFIAYKPDCVNVEEDELSSQDFIAAQNEVKRQMNVMVDNLFQKYGADIISKAVSLTNGRL